jgi:hypothetical protein
VPSITGSLSASGDSAALVNVDADTAVYVLGYQIMAADSDIAVTLKTGSTARATVRCPATGVGGISCPPAKEPYFQGLVGEDLIINLSGAGDVVYNVQYTTRP